MVDLRKGPRKDSVKSAISRSLKGKKRNIGAAAILRIQMGAYRRAPETDEAKAARVEKAAVTRYWRRKGKNFIGPLERESHKLLYEAWLASADGE